MINSLITADVHVSDNPNDEHRWGLFGWLRDCVLNRGLAIGHVFILGDLTVKFDRHPGVLVDRLRNSIADIAQYCNVWIVQGNHDAVDPEHPSFGFLDEFERVRFFSQPDGLQLGNDLGNCLFLPSARKPAEEWAEWLPRLNEFNFVFTHATFTGCVVENGSRLEGVSPALFKNFKGHVFAGDIHVPQTIGKNITYVGAPYRCKFGDSFTPRVLMLGRNKAGAMQTQDLHYPTKSKWVVDVSSHGEIMVPNDIQPGDQVNVRVHLKRADYHMWPKLQKTIKAMAAKAEWHLFGPELRGDSAEAMVKQFFSEPKTTRPVDLVRAYAITQQLEPDLRDVGLAIITQLTNRKP